MKKVVRLDKAQDLVMERLVMWGLRVIGTRSRGQAEHETPGLRRNDQSEASIKSLHQSEASIKQCEDSFKTINQ